MAPILIELCASTVICSLGEEYLLLPGVQYLGSCVGPVPVKAIRTENSFLLGRLRWGDGWHGLLECVCIIGVKD